MKTLKLFLFSLTLLFGAQIYAEQMLPFQTGQRAEVRVETGLEVALDTPIGLFQETEQEAVHMEIKLLNDGSEGGDPEVEVIVKDFYSSEEENPCFEALLERPLQFRIEGNYKAVETTGALEEATTTVETEVDENGVCTTTVDEDLAAAEFFNYALGQMFHLHNVPLKENQRVELPIIEWVDFCDDPMELQEDSIKGESLYYIREITPKKVSADIKGCISCQNEEVHCHVELNGKAEWSLSNPLVQQRSFKLYVHEDFEEVSGRVILEQEWTSRPLP